MSVQGQNIPSLGVTAMTGSSQGPEDAPPPKTSPADEWQLYTANGHCWWGGYCYAGFLPVMMPKAVEWMPGDKDMWQPLGKAKLELSELCCRARGVGVPSHQSFSAVNF